MAAWWVRGTLDIESAERYSLRVIVLVIVERNWCGAGGGSLAGAGERAQDIETAKRRSAVIQLQGTLVDI